MTSPLISIVIPVYNGSASIKETIQSCIAQTYANWEAILIDDGSTDESAEIIQSIRDDRIKYIYKENGGQASARNLGTKYAKGEWIAFLDADDIWVPSKLESQLAIFNNDKTVDLIFSSGNIFKDSIANYADYPIWKKGRHQGLSFAKELFCRSGIINSSVLLKRKFFDQFQLDENPNIKGTEDWDFWLKLALEGTVFYGMPEKLVNYREHEGGIHLNLVKMFLGKEQLYKKYIGYKDIPSLLVKKQFRYVYRELMNHLYAANKNEEVAEVFSRLKKQDKWGWGTLNQRILIKIFPLRWFMVISNKFIYRIAYRIEKIRYFMFLNE